jgi:hypothetical protein
MDCLFGLVDFQNFNDAKMAPIFLEGTHNPEFKSYQTKIACNFSLPVSLMAL